MAAPELPTWVAALGSLGGTGLVAAWVALKDRKAVAKEQATPVQAVAASVISDASIDKLVRVTREAAESHHDDSRRIRESNEDLRDAVCDLTKAVREGLPPVAPLDVAGLVARLNRPERKP